MTVLLHNITVWLLGPSWAWAADVVAALIQCGLLLAMADGTQAVVSKGADLAPIIVDRVPVIVMKEGKIKGNKVSIAHLNAMVRVESFLGQFRPLDLVTKTPMFLPRETPRA